MEPQFYWLGTSTNFMDHALFCHTNEDANGIAWNCRAVLVNRDSRAATHFDRIAFDTSYVDGTRRIASIALEMTDATGQVLQAQIEATGFFYMNGLGYTHPEWSHGRHHEKLEVAFDEIDLASAEDKLRSGVIHNLYVQALSQVTLKAGGRTHQGRGVIEQLFVGAHAPSGFREMFDRVMG